MNKYVYIYICNVCIYTCIYIHMHIYICISICRHNVYIHNINNIYIYCINTYILYHHTQSPRQPCSLPVLTKLDEVHWLHHSGLLGAGFESISMCLDLYGFKMSIHMHIYTYL